jgi:hypothetical protein
MLDKSIFGNGSDTRNILGLVYTCCRKQPPPGARNVPFSENLLII